MQKKTPLLNERGLLAYLLYSAAFFSAAFLAVVFLAAVFFFAAGFLADFFAGKLISLAVNDETDYEQQRHAD